MTGNDTFGRLDYRRFVAWKKRIKREWPFLLETFGKPGDRPLLDIACGTGEHTDALTSEGYSVIGLDFSLEMLEKARSAYPAPAWVAGDMARLPLKGDGCLGGALCLGNALAILMEDNHYAALFQGLKSLLAPGAPLLVQILNYRRILDQGIRHLPLNFRDAEGGELLYLRILDPLDPGRIRIEILTLERSPPEEESRIVQSSSRIMRPLRAEELEAFLKQAGFEDLEIFGDYAGSPYSPGESSDVIVVAR